jgi:hypothetical protein
VQWNDVARVDPNRTSAHGFGFEVARFGLASDYFYENLDP